MGKPLAAAGPRLESAANVSSRQLGRLRARRRPADGRPRVVTTEARPKRQLARKRSRRHFARCAHAARSAEKGPDMELEFVRYRPDVEVVDSRFDEWMRKILDRASHYTAQSVTSEGQAVRSAHATGYGLA